MTGYSATPLAQKLGITPGTVLAVLDIDRYGAVGPRSQSRDRVRDMRRSQEAFVSNGANASFGAKENARDRGR